MCDLTYTKEWNDNHIYQGFIDSSTGLYEGNGRIKFLSPSVPTQIYSGTFSKGKLTGSGTICYSDGSIYKGQIVDGKRNGMGSLYSSNGKFQYDGQWLNDIIDKPVYTPIIESGVLVSQGFKTGDKFDGWFITHEKGCIESIKFYQDSIAIKGFGSFNENLILKYSVNNTDKLASSVITKFLFEILSKLNKPGYLVDFLSNNENIELLEELSFPYDYETGGIIAKTSYKIFSSSGLEQINIYSKNFDSQICVNYMGSTVWIGLCDLTNKSKISGGKSYILTVPQTEPTHKVEIIDQSDSLTYQLIGDHVLLTEEGEFEFKNNIFKLQGSGIRIDGTNKYVGKFTNGEIEQGALYRSDKKIYDGSFVSNKFNGFGTEWFPNGRMKYEGEYKNGKFNGNGTSYYQNSETDSVEYVGNWLNDQKHGNGTLFSISGDEIFTGEFYRDQIA